MTPRCRHNDCGLKENDKHVFLKIDQPIFPPYKKTKFISDQPTRPFDLARLIGRTHICWHESKYYRGPESSPAVNITKVWPKCVWPCLLNGGIRWLMFQMKWFIWTSNRNHFFRSPYYLFCFCTLSLSTCPPPGTNTCLIHLYSFKERFRPLFSYRRSKS